MSTGSPSREMQGCCSTEPLRLELRHVTIYGCWLMALVESITGDPLRR